MPPCPSLTHRQWKGEIVPVLFKLGKNTVRTYPVPVDRGGPSKIFLCMVCGRNRVTIIFKSGLSCLAAHFLSLLLKRTFFSILGSDVCVHRYSHIVGFSKNPRQIYEWKRCCKNHVLNLAEKQGRCIHFLSRNSKGSFLWC